jgi:hypothetical protein
MFNTNLAYSISDEESVKDWDYFIDELSKVFNLSFNEKEKLQSSKVAKLIAAIPYVAKCNEPERTAIAHLCLYMSEIRGFEKFCSHNQIDDIYYMNRLSFIATFSGGDEKIINHGMNLLALAMIEGYNQSSKSDKEKGIYNPFVSKVWDYKQLKSEIMKELSKVYIPELDNFFYDDPHMFLWI